VSPRLEQHVRDGGRSRWRTHPALERLQPPHQPRIRRVLIEDEGVAQRALFIVDPKEVVRNFTINDVDVGRSVKETLRTIDALAFKDAFGQGCPADRKKGDEGIKTADLTKVEGPIELKKSWTEWARPKLLRTMSGNSQR